MNEEIQTEGRDLVETPGRNGLVGALSSTGRFALGFGRAVGVSTLGSAIMGGPPVAAAMGTVYGSKAIVDSLCYESAPLIQQVAGYGAATAAGLTGTFLTAAIAIASMGLGLGLVINNIEPPIREGEEEMQSIRDYF